MKADDSDDLVKKILLPTNKGAGQLGMNKFCLGQFEAVGYSGGAICICLGHREGIR